MKRKAASKDAYFLSGGGEMGALMRALDWSATSLGPVEKWPQSLQSSLGICLASAFPIAIYWGNDLTLLYNDAWSPIPGTKHPAALGKTAREVWPEIWQDIWPLFKKVFETGEASRTIDGLLPMQRHGYTEECYFDFTFTPIRGHDGSVEGIFNAVIETTYRVVNERRSAILGKLTDRLNLCKTIFDAAAAAQDVLHEGRTDIPFAAVYLLPPDDDDADCLFSTGMDPAPVKEVAAGDELGKAMTRVRQNRSPEVNAVMTWFPGNQVNSVWPEPVTECILLPIGLNRVNGFLVAGINPRRALDADYENFFRSIATSFSNTFYNIHSLEEERKRSEALAEIDRAKTVFFSNISHEFRTPLTLMLGPLRDLINGQNGNGSRETLELVHRNGIRLQKLVNSLLDFSRLEAGRMQGRFVPTDLPSYTADLASNFRSALDKAGIAFEVSMPSFSENIFVDRTMWEKIVLNLLSNAFKFTFEGSIRIGLEEKDDSAILTVTDTGVGIPKKDLPFIFDRFKRVEGARARSHEGSGIGLSLVKDLIQLHGGTIDVSSIEGKGTIFVVHVPKGTAHLRPEFVAEADTAQPASISAYIGEALDWVTNDGEKGFHQLPVTGNTGEPLPRIVLADDNNDMRQYVSRLLNDRFEVIAVADGKKALELSKELLPELLITDVMMPEMDGFALLQSLRDDPLTSRMPVIMLSARAGEEAKLEGIEAGADDYIVKPFSANELVARVSALIAARRSQRDTESRIYELFMQAPAIIALLRGPRHVFELANTYYREVVGSHRNLIGKPVIEALPELSSQGFVEFLDSVFHSGKAFYGNEMLAKLDRDGKGTGKEYYFDFVYQPLTFNGKVEGILVHATDVTGKVLARTQAREREELLKTRLQQQAVVTELGLLALQETDLATLLHETVTRVCKALDVEFAKVLELLPGGKKMILRAANGWTSELVVDSSTIETEGNLAGFTLGNEEPVIVNDVASDQRFSGPDLLSAHGIVSSMTCIIPGSGQQPYGILGVHSSSHRDFTRDDITFLQAISNILATSIRKKHDEDRIRQSTDRLRESEEKFRTLADNIPILCWMADGDGWIYWYNTRWYLYTGTTPEQVEGWGWQSVHDPHILPQVLDKWKQSLSSGTTFEMVYPLRGADNELRPFLTRVVPVKNEAGKVLQWFGTHTDITERELLARQKDEFLGIASHELKTPVTSIKASIQIINRLFADKAYDKAGNFLVKASLHIDKLTRLINDLLDVSRIQSGKMLYNFAHFAVRDIIEDTVEQISHQALQHQIIVHGNPDMKVWGDKVRLEQVVSNLLTNAIKYSPGADKVLVEIEEEKGRLKLSVTDFGIGIPEEKKALVFDRFFRVEKTSHQFQGLGLGLYISSEIIKRHGGRIGVTSEEGKGSVFYFIIPLQGKPESVLEKAAAS